jgi:hypothetical protein
LLVFVLRGCSSCKEFMPRLRRGASGLPVAVQDAQGDLAKHLGVKYAPTTLIVSRRGVHGRIESSISDAEIAQFLAPVRRYYRFHPRRGR